MVDICMDLLLTAKHNLHLSRSHEDRWGAMRPSPQFEFAFRFSYSKEPKIVTSDPLRTVPTIVTAYILCASQGRSSAKREEDTRTGYNNSNNNNNNDNLHLYSAFLLVIQGTLQSVNT